MKIHVSLYRKLLALCLSGFVSSVLFAGNPPFFTTDIIKGKSGELILTQKGTKES